MLIIRTFSLFLSIPHTVFLIPKVCVVQVWFFNIYHRVILPTYSNYDILSYSSYFKSLRNSPSLTYNLEFLSLRNFRVVFKGKGFRVRIYRARRKVTFNFGHSHWTKLKLLSFWFAYKLRRQSYVFITYDGYNESLFKSILPSIRVMNRYTQRGLRLKCQAIKRRFGKISQYISSLH